jgi:hypothetical protein
LFYEMEGLRLSERDRRVETNDVNGNSRTTSLKRGPLPNGRHSHVNMKHRLGLNG